MEIATSKLLTNAQINDLAIANDYEYRVLKSIIQIESGQHGFSLLTGKIIIQFEPAWFKREYSYWANDVKHAVWQSNAVGDQQEEWIAFNSAFAENPDAAMKSTSIGLMQVMGFHYAELGFKTVGAMWDYAKENEYNQVMLAIKWIKTVPALDRAIKNKDWDKIAYYYNGQNYKRYHYADRLVAAYNLIRAYSATN